MRIGVFVGASVADLMTLDGLLARIKQAEEDGFDSFWIPHISARGYDALTTLALAGMQTSRIELGVGVVPTYPRHPAALAQQALTTATASNGRFILGIGPSHRPGMEEGFGIPYDRPALHTREYLSVMRPLLEEGAVQFNGEFFNVNLELAALERPACPILVSALAPQMLNLAGQLADGTVTWMAGPRTIESHITPRISRAAENTGRAAPRVCVGLPTAVTDDENSGRQKAAESYAAIRRAGQLPPRSRHRRRGKPGGGGRNRQRSLPATPTGNLRRGRRHRLRSQRLRHPRRTRLSPTRLRSPQIPGRQNLNSLSPWERARVRASPLPKPNPIGVRAIPSQAKIPSPSGGGLGRGRNRSHQ